MSGGWEDDDDLNDMLFDDDDNDVNVSEDNNGWDDDDGLDGLEDDFSQENNNIAPPPPPPPPPPPAATIPSQPSSLKISKPPPPPPPAAAAATSETRMINMLQNHEKMMQNEIDQIMQSDEIRNNNHDVDDNDDNDDDDAWDFEDDEDIFNEENNEGSTTIPPQVSAPPPPPLPAKTKNNNHYMSEKEKNPFLQDSDDELDTTSPPAAAVIGDDNNNEDGGGGWSDEDFFDEDEDDELLDSSLPVQKAKNDVVASTSSTVPTLASSPPPRADHDYLSSPPVAHRTRSKMTPGPSQPPPPPPRVQQYQEEEEEVTLNNPSQRRIYQMLSNYTKNLVDDQYPSQLHYKLHMYQSQPRNSSTNTTTTPAAELRHYYAIRPKLRKYTLGVELTRMEYTLILENGKCTSDKDVIRSYFGVNDDGERIMMSSTEEEKMEDEEATVEELLIRSANQSLLADALAALTGSEEDVVDRHTSDDDFFDDANDDEQQHGVEKSMMGLILSGPTLCMTSVAETCQFTIDLQSGKVEAICDLAISVPFHGDVSTVQDLLSQENLQQHGENNVVENGRIVLAKAKISVRFRPGEGVNDFHDEPTVQYVVQSVKSLHAPNSPVLRHVAIALAHDQEDPFFQEEQRADVGDATDIRDLFLLNHHLLSDSGLLAVSDHLERLRGAAEAKSTGFRSALRQLDGVTNVSGKLQFLKGAANAGQGSGSGSGFLGLGLALPSAEAIEAAEREAHGAVVGHNDSGFRFPRPDEIEGHRFPRPNDVNEGNSRPYDDHRVRPTPPPPPPPPHLGHTPQTEQDITRPQPIIGGLFMSGLSRLAAAATQPSDTRNEGDWAEEGGTGLTPPSSPMANRSIQAPTNDFPTLYRKEEDIKNTSQPQVEGGREVLGLSSQPSASKPLTGPPTQTHLAQESGNGRSEHSGDVDGDDDGWSDDEFDFEENANEDFLEEQQEIGKEEGEKVHTAAISPGETTFADNDEAVSSLPQGPKSPPSTTKNIFNEELTAAIQARIERENKEMLESGRLKRWTPLSQDPLVRQRLMEVMINTLRH